MWKDHRSKDKRYPGDNRLISPKSSHRRGGLAPRCRLIASWGWRRSQGFGCSPIKKVRELGSDRQALNNIECLTHLNPPNITDIKNQVYFVYEKDISIKLRRCNVVMHYKKSTYIGKTLSNSVEGNTEGSLKGTRRD